MARRVKLYRVRSRMANPRTARAAGTPRTKLWKHAI